MATSYRSRLRTPYRISFVTYSTSLPTCSVVLLLCLLVPAVTSLAPKPKRDLCDLSNGAWIRSPKRFPRYTTVAGRPKSCPFARSSYACERNNRPDLRYREYRWQPFDCPISYFSSSGFRFLMRDRRMLLVGDSMMSNLFEALLCSISSVGYEGQYYFTPYIVRTSRRSIRNKATGKDAGKGGHGFDVYVDEMDPVLEHVLANYSAVVFHSGELVKHNLGLSKVMEPHGWVLVVLACLPRAPLCTQADRSWRVVDLGSSNGTSLNGVHLQEGRERPLSDGDEIRFGPFTIVRVHLRPSPHHGSTVRDMLQQQMEWRLCRLEEQAATMEEQMRQDMATLKTSLA
ncbi:unnamed protein product [Closterium sp. Naga37s-1]|nr:unnamed protein product [Closterium sp. Naga37s-1]